MTSRLAGTYEPADAIPSRTLGTVSHFSPRPLLLKFGAVTFLVAMTAYSVGLIYYMRHAEPAASFGATYEFVIGERAIHLAKVAPSGPAARAGLRSNDRIVAVNGRSLSSVYPFWDSVERGRPTQIVRLAVQRAGNSTIEEVPVTLGANPVPNRIGTAELTAPRVLALHVLSFYPIPFLVVAGVVLIQRFSDRNAWLLAVMFAGFVVGTQLPTLEPIIHPALRKPLLAYWVLWAAVAPGALYYFFSTFPEPTSLDRRLPWLKVVFLAFPLMTGAALSVVTLGSMGRPFHLALGPTARAYVDFVLGIYSILGYGLGLVSLCLNSFVASPETRRRTRVMLWGTAGAVLPFLILGSFAVYRGMEFIELPFWLWMGAIFAIFLLPLSFAYAVVKHRVMEIPVLLRRSARYVVVRHSIVIVGIVIGVALTFAFAALFSRVLADGPERRALSGVAGAMFGVLVAVATRSGVSQVTQRLDRAFFREAYDARQLLQNLARRTRDATDPRQLAELLEQSLREALHPATIFVLLRTPADRLEVVTPAGNQLAALDALSVDRETFVRFGAIPVKRGELPSALTPLAVVDPELIAAMQGHDEQVEGLLVFGARLTRPSVLLP